jgi:NAD(P)H dehydrogenase (quinone)
MQIQVVCCHPLTDSYDHALFQTVVSTLDQNGHGVVATDLYREGFAPAMTVEERRTYMSNDYDASAVARYVEILKQVDGLILCFPHWWFSMPAMLKGWVDRVWGPGTAFLYDSKDGHLRPNLHNIKLFGVVTSYGSSWWIVRVFAGDAGRKVLMRGMKPLCAKDAQSFYLAHYGMDASTPASREAFLEKVRRRISRI